MKLPASLFLILFPVAASAASAQTIENEFLAVTSDGQALSCSSKTTGRTFLKGITFPSPIKEAGVRACDDAIWGTGRELKLVHENGWETSVRLFPAQPFLHLHTRVENAAKSALNLKRIDLAECELDLSLPADRLRTLGTPGLGGIDAPGSYATLALADPESRRGIVAGWLTHDRGVGAFLPAKAKSGGSATVRARLEFGQYRVEPGKSRPTDILVLGYFEDARLGLEAYADAVAKQCGIRLRPQPSVYCTWYHAGASNEEKLAANTGFAARELRPFGLSVIQIDDKWQSVLPKGFEHEGKIKTTGPVKVFMDANDNFPHGMAHTAADIAGQGFLPGIWYMPFAGNYRNPYFDPDIFAQNPDGTPFHDSRWSGTCLDLSRPAARDYVAETARRLHGWGYRYFKLDGMHTGAPSHNIYVQTEYREDCFPDSRLRDPGMTHVEALRKGLNIIRENAPDTFLLGCNVSQNMVSMGPAFGLLDGMRIGPDNGSAGRGDWNAVKKGAWHGSNLYFLNGRVWHNDPDPVYVRPDNPLPYARLMCSWVAVSGSMLTASYQFADLPPERLDLLKRTMPSHGLLGRPADLFESDQANIWLLTDTRRPVRRDVIGLFNWDEKQSLTIDRDLEWIGLEPADRYVAYDFWERRFLDPIEGKLRQELPGGSCRVLAVRPAADHPQLLSTSRHIAQCMVDVLEERWDPATKTLSGISRIIGGDPCELRIALPAKGSWETVDFKAEGAEICPGDPSPLGICAILRTGEDREVKWTARFSVPWKSQNKSTETPEMQ